MLHIKKSYECLVEFDPYIALKVTFGIKNYLTENTAYWRTGDFENQFIEIGVSEEQGTLRSITLVLIKQINLEIKDLPEIQLTPGIPAFEKINYDKNLLFDEIGSLEMRVGKNKLQVFFSDNSIVSGFVCNRVTCLFDKEGIFCGFEVADITQDERMILEENFINRK